MIGCTRDRFQHERTAEPSLIVDEHNGGPSSSSSADGLGGRRRLCKRDRRSSPGRVERLAIYRRGALALALGLLLPPRRWTSSSPSSSLLLLPSFFASAFTVERRPFSHGIERIVFGTAALSKSPDPHSILDAAYEKGFRRFDLAHTYGAGESERIFGRWLESRTNGANGNRIDRRELDIITKGGIGDDAFGDPDRPLLTRESLRSELDESLDALGVDDVDLYMYHRDDARIPAEDFVDWINAVGVRTGKAKRWGVSNWTFERFREAHSYARSEGLVPPTANSPQYSLANPDGEVWPGTYSISGPECEDEIDWYQDRGVELLCWEVLAKGFMAKSTLWPEHEVDPATFASPAIRGSDEWRVRRIQRAYCNAENYRRRNLAVRLADACGVNLAQIAMLYPLTRGGHISVIFGSSKADHLDDMMALRHMNIDDEAMTLLAGRERPRRGAGGGDDAGGGGRFAFLPQLLGGGRNNVRPARLSRAAREADLASRSAACAAGAASEERAEAAAAPPMAFTIAGASSK